MVNRNTIKINVEMVYKRKQKPEKVNWYQGDWGSKLLFKLRTGSKWERLAGPKLQLLCRGEGNHIEHLIVACTRYEEERQRLTASVVEIKWRREME